MSEAIQLSSDWDAVCVPRLGVAHLTRRAFAGEDLRPLWSELMAKASDDAKGAGMGMDLSVISQLMGNKDAGLAIQKEMLALQRVYRSPCAVAQPRLRVLALAAEMDIGGNTPLEFLLDGSDIGLATFTVVPGMALPCPLPDHDVAIITACDGDATRATMETIAALMPAWPRPVLNLPRHIGVLDRDRLFHCLADIAGLEIPQTARITRLNLTALAKGEIAVEDVLPDGRFPLVVRPIGSHAGFGLAKVDDAAALATYLGERAETEFFISRFVDYTSPDGMFRKYRLVMIDGKPYACHMAICEEWKVWYLNAEMAASIPNRMEEALFMHGFDDDFAVRHAGALEAMARRVGLDYFAIDCAETQSGDLLIFEADNTAIVHDMDPPNVYPYKADQMHKIFHAVQAMLYRRAGRSQARAA